MKHILLIETILYVSNQELSSAFYERIFRQKPNLDVPGMTEFVIAENIKIGLMPNKGIAKILDGKTPDPESGTGIPRCELYFYVEDIHLEFDNAINSGAKLISPISERN